MFNFIMQDSLSNFMPVTNKDISRIEKKFSIVFPDILKKYYLKYNGTSIYTVELSYDGGEITGVHEIIPVITNEMIDGRIPSEFSVECIKENELNEPYNRVQPNLIPFAINEGGIITTGILKTERFIYLLMKMKMRTVLKFLIMFVPQSRKCFG